MKKLFTILYFLITSHTIFSQGVGVGTTTPNSSAVLDVSSTTKGMLMPRMTTAQRNAIVSPAIGLQVLNLDDMCIDVYDGAYWIKNCGLKVIGQDTSASVWIQKANFPNHLDFAVGFSIGNKGYIGTGFTNVESRQFWEYDPVNNTWAQKADFGGTARTGAAGFSINNKGYIGTGYFFFSALRDFWEYNPTNNAWIQKADFGGPAIYAAVGFSISGKGYIGSGRNQNNDFLNEFWEYNPVNDTWVQKTNYPGEGAEGAVGFAIGSKGYLGTGNSSNEFWEFNPINNTWIQRANFEGEPRIEAVGFSLNGLGYIGTGQSGPTILGDFWSYNPATNLWTQEANYGGEVRVGAVGFAIGNIGYIGLGIDDVSLSDFWAYNLFPVSPIYEHAFDEDNVAQFDDGIWTREHEDVFLSSSGKVGIGTSIPTAKLEVVGSLIQRNGNVGLGNTTPHAPLQFDNAADNRKLVLNEVADNDHQFYGMGSGTNLLQFQVGATTGAHTFFAGTNATTSNELMRITGTGNVGIGNTNPHAPLQFNSTADNRKIVVNEVADNDHQFYGLGSGTNMLQFQVGATTGAHTFFAGANATTSNELMRITGTGNVGIGNNNPHAPLHFNNANDNRKLVVSEVADNDHQFYGMGSGTNLLQFQVGTTSGVHAFFAGTNATSSIELMRITGNGNVGIGNTNPHAPLHFNNAADNRKLVVNEIADNDHQFYGIGSGTNTLQFQVGATTGAHVFFAGTNPITSNELMRITGTGNVGIGTAAPANSAILELSSTTKGILMPRMTTAQRNAIVTPASGLQILNLDDMCMDMYDGTNWIKNCGLKVIGQDTAAPGWIQKASMAHHQNWGVGFSIGNKGYIGTGYIINLTREFWEYDPANNTWTQKADFGGTPRYQAIGFSIGNKGYIGTGFDNTGDHKKDFWEYDPANNAWIQKADVGGNGRYAAVGFSINSKGYIGSGTAGNDFWEFNPANNTWVQKTNYPGNGGFSGVGFSIGNKGYIGTGNNTNEFWEYDQAGNSWTQKANFGGAGRSNAVGFSLNGKGYIGAGLGATWYSDFWEYNPSTNMWKQKADIGGAGRQGAIGFAIGNSGYIGLGIGSSAPFTDFWQYDLFPLGPVYENAFNQGNAARFNDGIWTREMENIFLSGSGNVGIGNNNPSQKLVVNGNGVFTGTVTASCGVLACSDMRYKINVQPIEHALNNIIQLQGITYDWNKEKFPEKEFNDRLQIGISAQELEKVYPEMVFTDSDGYKTVDYSRLTPVLIEGMKEQQRQIEELQQQVRKLVEMVSSEK